jgi:hypothetical protein
VTPVDLRFRWALNKQLLGKGMQLHAREIESAGAPRAGHVGAVRHANLGGGARGARGCVRGCVVRVCVGGLHWGCMGCMDAWGGCMDAWGLPARVCMGWACRAHTHS